MRDGTMMSLGRISMDHDTEAHDNSQTSQAALAEGYRQMAADREHEAQAQEWAEALIGDTMEAEEERVSG
jgi:hypothetical protein